MIDRQITLPSHRALSLLLAACYHSVRVARYLSALVRDLIKGEPRQGPLGLRFIDQSGPRIGKLNIPPEMWFETRAANREDAVHTLLFFGAGASAGSIDSTPTLPPVGDALFYELARFGDVAVQMELSIKDEFRRSFERGMDRLCSEQPVLVPYFLREMASYFSRFVPGKRSLYNRIAAIVGRCRHDVVLSTTNYDLLLEHALASVGYVISYDLGIYSTRDVRLLKVHGSCGFLPDESRFKYVFQGIEFTGSPKTGLADFPFRPITRRRAIEMFCREQSLPPAMCMYLRGKPAPFGGTGITAHLTQWQRGVRSAQKVWIVGVRVNEEDTHIWDTLAECPGKLAYVGLTRDTDSFRSWSQRRGRSKDEAPAHSFLAALPLIERDLLEHMTATVADDSARVTPRNGASAGPVARANGNPAKRTEKPLERGHAQPVRQSAVDLLVARNWFGNTNGSFVVAGSQIFLVEAWPNSAVPLLTLDVYNQFGDTIAIVRRNKVQQRLPWLYMSTRAGGIELRRSTGGPPLIKARNLDGGAIEVSHIFLYAQNGHFILAQTRGETCGLDVWRVRLERNGEVGDGGHVITVADDRYRCGGGAVEIRADGRIECGP